MPKKMNSFELAMQKKKEENAKTVGIVKAKT